MVRLWVWLLWDWMAPWSGMPPSLCMETDRGHSPMNRDATSHSEWNQIGGDGTMIWDATLILGRAR